MKYMKTIHQYLPLYPIEPESRRLIVGTIHPQDPSRFKVKFFYGNKGSLWTILHKAFPSELTDPDSVESIRSFLKVRKIAMSDTVAECSRKRPTALDTDLTDIRLHEAMIPQIRHSAIKEIFFTSGFGTNNAFKLFYVDLLKQRITADMRGKREFMLSEHIFGRPVRLHILHSPAGTANISLSKNSEYLAERHRYEGVKGPVQAFKIDYYRRVFAVS